MALTVASVVSATAVFSASAESGGSPNTSSSLTDATLNNDRLATLSGADPLTQVELILFNRAVNVKFSDGSQARYQRDKTSETVARSGSALIRYVRIMNFALGSSIKADALFKEAVVVSITIAADMLSRNQEGTTSFVKCDTPDTT